MNTKSEKVWIWAEIVAMSREEMMRSARVLHQYGCIVVLRPDHVDEDRDATTFVDVFKLVDADQVEDMHDELANLLDSTDYGDVVECGPARAHHLPWSAKHRPVHPGNLDKTGVASSK